MTTDLPGDAVPVDRDAWTGAGTRMMRRGTENGDPAMVRRAVTRFEAVLASCPAGTACHGPAAVNLANALVTEFEMTGRDEALATAVAILTGLDPASAGFGDREQDFHGVLGHALLRDAERTGLAATAAAAADARREALRLTRRHEPAYAGRLSDLGAALAAQARLTGDTSILREAEKLHRRAVRNATDAAEYPGALSGLASCLDDLAMGTGDANLLKEAVQYQREAVQAEEPGSPLWPMLASNLGNSLEHWFEATGDRAALEDAIGWHREAMAATPVEHVEHSPRAANLAVALQSMYERTGDPGLLEEAISNFADAASGTPEQYGRRLSYLHGLASAQMRMSERTGDLSAVDEAIALWGDVVMATPDDHPAKPGRLSALATAMLLRSDRDRSDVGSVDMAIGILREALALTPAGHPQRAMLLSNLGALYVTRFERTGVSASLDEALRVHQEAAGVKSADDSRRGSYLANYGIALLVRARASDDPADAARAADVLSAAMQALDPDDPGVGQALHALGAAHGRQFELGNEESLSEALAMLARAADAEAAPVAVRIRAGRDRGQLAALARAGDVALEALAGAVLLMEEAAWAGMDRGDQQRLLSELSGLPTDAAAMAIEAGQLRQAIELLERGRGILLGRQLEASDMAAQLMSRAPELAGELAWVQSALDQAAGDNAGGMTGDTESRRPVPVAADRQRKLAQRRAAVLEEIRQQPCLQDLVGPLSFGKLAQAASLGPVVVVNISRHRCDALIISSGQVRLVPLPAVTAEAVAEHAGQVRDDPGSGLPGHDQSWRDRVDEVLRWTWDTIVEPVFTDLGFTGSAPAGEEPRIWWCATGLSSFLPLHAAGAYQAPGWEARNALDLAISSFTPTLRTLLRLRDRQPDHSTSGLGPLVVAMPKTPGLKDLESPEREAAYLSGRLTSLTLLQGSAATRDAVADAMTQHAWAHFSCHGSQDLSRPDRGALHLHDGALTVPQIMRLSLPAPALAYLSACDTSIGGTSIPDEAITLASALLVAGYRHVIGTLWPIWGLTATDVAQSFYDQFPGGDHAADAGFDTAAAALRSALRAVRDAPPGWPAVYWAAYVHNGP